MRYATLQDHIGGDKSTAIERAAAVGLDGLELIVPDGVHNVGPHGMALDMTGLDAEADEVWSPEERADLREHADEHGIELTSLCPSFLNFRPGLTAPDESERAAVAGILEELVAAADDLGAGVILVPFFREAEIGSVEERERVAEAIAPVVGVAEDAGVTLALETSLPADGNRKLLEAIDSPAAGVYYDVGNATSFGFDPAAELRDLADCLAPRVHFKDGDGGGANRMLGEGDVDFAAVADALSDIGYDEWILLETLYRDDPVADMRENLAFARSLF